METKPQPGDTLGEKIPLTCAYGPVAFGVSSSMSVVAWSGGDTKDLLYSRLWDAVCLYPSRALGDEELAAEPRRLMKSIRFATAAAVADWNKDGKDDLIAANRVGFLHYLERGESADGFYFADKGLIRDADSGLPFNIPYDNPHNPFMDNLSGYIESPFFNYPLPVRYPSPNADTVDLIVGDLAGNLWWMPDSGDGQGQPAYRGIVYTKPADRIVSRHGKEYVAEHGYDYARPPAKIGDEHGRAFLLGIGYEKEREYPGGNVRPAIYRNEATGQYDLLVLTGIMNQKLIYLKRVGTGEGRQPLFRNLGEVDLGGFFEPWNIFYFHAQIAVFEQDGRNDLLVSQKHHVAVFRNRRTGGEVPEFRFERYVSGPNANTSGNNFTEILTCRANNKRYLLDNCLENFFALREIVVRDDGQAALALERIPLRDQHGVFTVEGETDAQGGRLYYGFNRACLWDYDNSGSRHLIVGTDKGLLYLLAERPAAGGGDVDQAGKTAEAAGEGEGGSTGGDAGEGAPFVYRSYGPLRDSDGEVIRVHNRACPCPVDLSGDGREDLLVGGVSYQLGIPGDPQPGGSIVRLLHKGLDEQGLPILERAGPVPVRGHAFHFAPNHHVCLQAVDLDGDGRKKIVISCNESDFAGLVFEIDAAAGGIDYTGRTIGRFGLEERLLDLDGDGGLELVFGGGEEGVAHYRKFGKREMTE